jgi:hypothetical protein
MLEGQGAKFDDDQEEVAEEPKEEEPEAQEEGDGAKKAPVQRAAGGLG